jgi:hypothetical protein
MIKFFSTIYDKFNRDRLRESPISSRYIDVVIREKPTEYSNPNSDQENNYSSYSDEDPNEFVDRNLIARPFPIRKYSNGDTVDIQGSIDTPLNPVNYGGTQINVWGFPTPDLAGMLDSKTQMQPNVGYLTDQMIKVDNY